MYIAVALLAALLATINAFPTDSSGNGLKTCVDTLKTNLQSDTAFQTQVKTLVNNGDLSAARDKVLSKVHDLCPDQYATINAFVEQNNASIQILENMYKNLDATEKANVEQWIESKDYKSLMQFFAAKFQALSPEDQQTLKTTFTALLKPFIQQNGPIIEKFLKTCTPEEKAQIEQYFTNGEFDKLDALVKTKLASGSFTSEEIQQINSLLGTLSQKQGTA